MTNIKIQKRDEQIKSFLEQFRIADVDAIAKLFFNGSTQSASKRLLKLVNANYLHRWREDNNILVKYSYYVGEKPKNWKHSQMLSRIYATISSEVQIVKVFREYELKYYNKKLFADMLLIVKNSKGEVVPIIVECEMGTKKFQWKYDDYITSNMWQQKFGVRPQVIVFYKDRLPKSRIDIITCKLNEI